MAHIARAGIVYAMSADNQPVVRVAMGSSLEVETHDCFENQLRTPADRLENLNWNRINPATGPIYVEGAEPGDLLKVEILSIDLADQAVIAVVPGSGALPDRITESASKIMPVRDGFVHFDDQVRIPLKPMIGVIGTAPAEGAVPTGTPGSHGGNMDCREIGPGATLYLPVCVPGALLALGDLHAAMGDGEVCVAGAEVAGTVSLRVSVLKNLDLPTPFLVTAESAMTIYSASELMAAVRGATERMADFVAGRARRPFSEALMLLSLAGNARLCQVVDPLMTARMEVPLSVLASLGVKIEG
jgi:amidase